MDNYQIQTYLQTMLYTPKAIKNTLLGLAMYYPDTSGAHDLIAKDVKVNPGEYVRSTKTSKSQLIRMQGRISIDCFNVSRPLVENVSILLQFIPNHPKMCLVSDITPEPKLVIEIEECYLKIPRIKPKVSLLGLPASYPWTKMETIKFLHSSGIANFNAKQVYTGSNIPRRAYVVLLDEARFDGKYKKNRLNFKPYAVDNIVMIVNDVHKPYYNGYECDFGDLKYESTYVGLFTELNKIWSADSIDITYTDFADGYCIFAFDLSQNRTSAASFYTPPQGGSVQLRMHFKTAPTENIVVLVMLEHERMLYIDKDRNWSDKEALE